VADEEAIQLKRERLAIETHEYFWHTCPELTARWKEAVLRRRDEEQRRWKLEQERAERERQRKIVEARWKQVVELRSLRCK